MANSSPTAKKQLLIVANNNFGTSQSGGDTIFLNFIKYWQPKLNITVFGSVETQNLLKRYRLKPKFIKTDNFNPRHQPTTLNIILHALRRIIKALPVAQKNKQIFQNSHFCYTASDFLPDLIFGLIYKLWHPQGVWISAQYLIAPKPTQSNSPYLHQPLKGLFYYLSQKITLPLAKKYADIIMVTSKPDKNIFPRQKVIVVQGGVDVTPSQKYLNSPEYIPIKKRKYAAVYLGRLHSQKGVGLLIDIWQIVVSQIPSAKLAIIGDGQLEKIIRNKIFQYKLNNNITLFGFQIGQKKFQILKDSQIVVHPATYDSGGMSAAEAMAWGLPGVSFDLESLKTYYPKGVLKSHPKDIRHFAQNIIKLLTNQKTYSKYSKQALDLIHSTWDWSKRSEKIFQQIIHD